MIKAPLSHHEFIWTFCSGSAVNGVAGFWDAEPRVVLHLESEIRRLLGKNSLNLTAADFAAAREYSDTKEQPRRMRGGCSSVLLSLGSEDPYLQAQRSAMQGRGITDRDISKSLQNGLLWPHTVAVIGEKAMGDALKRFKTARLLIPPQPGINHLAKYLVDGMLPRADEFGLLG